MEAGPELNQLIAVEVMGAEAAGTLNVLWRLSGGPPYYLIDGQIRDLPDYSDNDAAACQVLDRMYSDGWTVDVGSLALVPRGWRSHMTNTFCDDFYTHPRSVEANGDTRALAICLAALKAKGVEVP